jgi:hypothetical protein
MNCRISPLDELATQYIAHTFPWLTSSQLALAHQTIISYLGAAITSDQASRTFQAEFGNTDPIDWVTHILEVPNEPIPSFQSPGADLGRRKPHPWTPFEDQRLIAGIHRFGSDNWGLIANFIGNNRTRAQTSQRWQRVLDPRISRDIWTKEEEEQLVSLVGQYGLKSWIKVAKDLGTRSDVQCRYRYNQLKADAKRPQPEIPQVDPLERQLDASMSGLLDKIYWEPKEPLSRAHDCGFIGSSFFDLPW